MIEIELTPEEADRVDDVMEALDAWIDDQVDETGSALLVHSAVIQLAGILCQAFEEYRKERMQ